MGLQMPNLQPLHQKVQAMDEVARQDQAWKVLVGRGSESNGVDFPNGPAREGFVPPPLGYLNWLKLALPSGCCERGQQGLTAPDVGGQRGFTSPNR